jgi:hypothetical protein
MHSVIRTPTFLNDARAAGLSEDDQQLIVVAISENPMLGDVMPGTGGCRKVRLPGKEKVNAAVIGRFTTTLQTMCQ